MKGLVGGAVLVAAIALCAPALAASQSSPLVTGYVNAGYSYADFDPAKLNVLQGRVGLRVGKYIGAEGEGAFGVSSDHIDAGGIPLDAKLKSEFAGYLIGFIPLSDRADIFGRVGYGHSTVSGTVPGVGSASVGVNSWNFGGGAQVFVTQHDGLRAEFTRFDYRNGYGSANIYSISYVRRFP
jgi:hypothetical protein